MLGVQPCQPGVLELSGIFTRFLVRPEYMGGAGTNAISNRWLTGTNSGTHPGEGPAARLKAEAHLCTAAYLRPHHGAGGFRTAA